MGGRDFSGLLCLAPTMQLVEGFRKQFHNATGLTSYIPPTAMTLRAYASSLCTRHTGRAPVSPALVPTIIKRLSGRGEGYSKLVADFIGEIKRQYPGQGTSTVKDAIARAFDKYAIPQEAARALFDALELADMYNASLERAGAYDPDDACEFSVRAIEHEAQPAVLVLEGFYEVTPNEERLLHGLMQRAMRSVLLVPISSPDDDLSHCYTKEVREQFSVAPVLHMPDASPSQPAYYAYTGAEEEIEGIARSIKQEHISGRYRDLASTVVVFPRLASVRASVERILGRYGVAVRFSKPKAWAQLRPCQDLLGLVGALSGGLARLAFGRVLISQHFEGIPPALRAMAPRLCLDASFSGGLEGWLDAFKRHGLEDEARGLMHLCEQFIAAAPGRKASEISSDLIGICKALGYRTSGDVDLADVYEMLMRVGELDRYLPGGVSLEDYAWTLARAFEAAGPGGQAQGVLVAEFADIRGMEPDVLYVAGLRDGEFPTAIEMDFLLPEPIRKALGLMDLRRSLSLQEHIFKRLVGSARRAVLSFSIMQGDAEYLPSVFLAGYEMREGLAVSPTLALCEQEAQVAMGGGPLSKSLAEATGVYWLRKGQSIRVTDVDGARSCPRRFYIERVLNVSPFELRQFEADPMVVGTIVHKVMEGLMTESAATLAMWPQQARELFDRLAPEFDIDSYFYMVLREAFIKILPEIVEMEQALRDEGYAFSQAEVKFTDAKLDDVVLRGTIDRMDKNASGEVQVIDYKTGSARISATRVKAPGEGLQLFLYAAMLEAIGTPVKRVGLYSLKDCKISWVPGKRTTYDLNECKAFALGHLQQTMKSILKGDFSAMPIDDQSCRGCHEKPYCPYIQRSE